MKKLIFFSLIIFGAMSLLPQAKIQFKQTTINFGEVENGRIVKVKFEFENAGDKLLIIKNISTSCGCTVAKFDKKEYVPGEKGSIPIQFFTSGRTGKVMQTITVSSNDKDNIYSRLTLTGRVIIKNFASIEINPKKINFKEAEFNQPYEQTITIKNPGTEPLNIIEITHSPDLYLQFDQRVINPNESAEIKLVFKPLPPFQREKYITFLKIRSNAHKQYLAIVRIEAKLSPQNSGE